jgi:hypothetical protein
MPWENTEKREAATLGIAALVILIVLVVTYLSASSVPPILGMWLLGAAALGLVSGFISGASEKEGTAEHALGFLSAGVVVPILVGIAALLRAPQTTTEQTTYDGEHITKKVVDIVNKTEVTELHPLWVVGSFFVVFGLSTIVGIALGVRRRNETINKKPGGIKLRG